MPYARDHEPETVRRQTADAGYRRARARARRGGAGAGESPAARFAARASMRPDRSMPTSFDAGPRERQRDPSGAAPELEHRPANAARHRCQNRTSRRPSVRAFSQS